MYLSTGESSLQSVSWGVTILLAIVGRMAAKSLHIPPVTGLVAGGLIGITISK